MAARRRLCSMAVPRVGSFMGQPSAYPCAASARSTIVRIDYRLQGMGARRPCGRSFCAAPAAVGWHPN